MRAAKTAQRHVACVLDASCVASLVAVHERLEQDHPSGFTLSIFCRDELSRAVLRECALPGVSLIGRHELKAVPTTSPFAEPPLTACIDWLAHRAGAAAVVEPIDLDEHLRTIAGGLESHRLAARSLASRFPYLPNQEEPRVSTPPRPTRPTPMPLHITTVNPFPARASAPAAMAPDTPNRTSVRDAIARAGMDAPLFAALSGVSHALTAAFGASHTEAARAVLMSLVADALEGRADHAGGQPVNAAPKTSAAEARAPKTWVAPPSATPNDREPEPITSERVQSLVKLIEHAAAADNLDAADRYVGKLMDLRPTDPDVRLTAGHLAMRRGRLRSAEEHFVRAGLFSSEAGSDVKTDVATAFVALARSWLASSESDLARLDVQRALRLAPDHEEARALDEEIATGRVGGARDARETATRDALFAQGEKAAAAGDWPKALDVFSSILTQHATFVPAQVGWASACLALGRIDEGLDALGRACQLDLTNVALHVQLGALYLQSSKLEAAHALFEGLASTCPESVDARLGLAESHRLAGRPLDAINILERAHRERSDEPAFIAAIGMLAAELGDREAAATALETLRAMAPEHPRTMALETSLRGVEAFAP
ncbi:MAG: tetratricopeptide repeat protein [Deltaproteobacteria bacterium]|nr:tetratricopeptide repeat protein [Deltaproteobacteria bacterium]